MKDCAILFFLYFMISCCSALRCYVCNSAFDKDCDQSPPPENFLATCTREHYQPVEGKPEAAFFHQDDHDHPPLSMEMAPAAQTKLPQESARVSRSPSAFSYCRKLIIDIPKQNNGNNITKAAHRRVFRSCGWIGDRSGSVSNCRWVAGGSKVQNHQCVCNEDKCNASGKLNAASAAILALASIGVTIIVRHYVNLL